MCDRREKNHSDADIAKSIRNEGESATFMRFDNFCFNAKDSYLIDIKDSV